MATSTTSSVRFLEAGTPVEPGPLVLLKMTGQEELGRLPEFQLEFSCPHEVAPEDILGKNISWALELPGGAGPRYFNGFVTRFAETGESMRSHFERSQHGKVFLYHAVVHPWLWFLKRSSNCRIFQNMTAIEIAKKVFEGYPFGTFEEVELQREYPTRLYCVQYRETDFNFVSRLFEQEGIYYAYKYENGKNTLLIMDSKEAHTTEHTVPFHPHDSIMASDDGLETWSVNREIQAGTYVIEDFDYLNPRNKPSGTKSGDKAHDLAEFQMYDYPGEFGPDEGEQYAETRIEELHACYEQFAGTGNLRLAEPGTLIKLEGHPRPAYNDVPYLLTAVTYSATAPELSSGGVEADFHCTVSAISGSTQFRPLRKTPKPVIQGPQTAIVVGQGDEEIYIDADAGEDPLGRIKVMFHWDRYSEANENSSCWVRVAQPIAGNRWGVFGLPRVGQEVVVEFLEGDPDRPLVTGSVYNADQKPPYELPAEKMFIGLKTHSTPQGATDQLNELRFKDEKDAELIFIQAQKDKEIRIKNDRLEWVKNESHLIVAEGNAFEKRGADHHVTLANNRNEKLGGSLSLDIANDLHCKTGTLTAYEAGQEIHLKAGTTLVLESGTTLTLKVGSNHLTIDQQGVSIKGAKIAIQADATVEIVGALTKINSGASPSAAATGSGVKVEAPEEPREPGETEGGDMLAPEPPVPPEQYGPQAQMFQMAAASGTPFCEICNCPPA